MTCPLKLWTRLKKSVKSSVTASGPGFKWKLTHLEILRHSTRFTLKNVLSFQKRDTNVLPSSSLIFPVAVLICLNPTFIWLYSSFWTLPPLHGSPLSSFSSALPARPKRKREGIRWRLTFHSLKIIFAFRCSQGLFFCLIAASCSLTTTSCRKKKKTNFL